MSIEPVIAFFVVWDLRKILKNTSPNPSWDKYLKVAMYAVAAVFIAQIFLPAEAEAVSIWPWHLFLLAVIFAISYYPIFFAARTLMFAVLPIVLLSFLGDLFKLFFNNQYKIIHSYLEVASVFTIIWMGAMLLLF